MALAQDAKIMNPQQFEEQARIIQEANLPPHLWDDVLNNPNFLTCEVALNAATKAHCDDPDDLRTHSMVAVTHTGTSGRGGHQVFLDRQVVFAMPTGAVLFADYGKELHAVTAYDGHGTDRLATILFNNKNVVTFGGSCW